MKYTYELPDKPSELIRKALEDMEAVEQMPGYKINLDRWHEPIDEICEVCLSGATMVAAGLPKYKSIYPDDTNGNTRAKLYALNQFRRGSIFWGLRELDIENEKLEEYMDVTPYHIDPNQFKADMHSIADYLEQNGY